MSKFGLKLTVYLGIIISIILLLNRRWTHTEVYLLQDEKYKIHNIPKTIDICNVGSSHGMSDFEYSSLPDPYEGCNFGRPSQMFYYDLQTLKHFRRKLNDQCVVIIPISYFSYYQYFDEEEFLNKEYVYYTYLDFKYIKNKSIELALEHKWFPVLYIKPEQIKYLINDQKGAIEEYDKIFDKNKFYDEDTQNMDMERLLAERDKTVKKHTKGFDRGISLEAIDKLKEMIEYCEGEGYQCILITTPLTKLYNDAEVYDKTFFDTFYGITHDIAKQYDIPYWDYSHDPAFEEQLNLFYDDDHLNHAGQKKFSDMVITRIFDEGYMPNR